MEGIVLEGRSRAATTVLQGHAHDGVHHVLEQLRERLLAVRRNAVLPERVDETRQVVRPQVVEQAVRRDEAQVPGLHVQRIGRTIGWL